jgi:predicted 3-demethylubiquinone-9 3-methyltransferase (glyoxalase superfamily)
MTSKPFTTCLWFDGQGEEAARFYTSIFKNSSIDGIARHTEAGPGPVGTVLTVEFSLNGQKFLALNGGPQFTFDEAVSIIVEAEDQAEVDYYWERLTEGGREQACGWLKDRYGFCWQIVPSAFLDMIKDPDQQKVARVMAAMMTMTKFDIAALQAAAGNSV